MKKYICLLTSALLLVVFCTSALAASCGTCGSSNLSYTSSPCDECYNGNVTYRTVHPTTGVHKGHTLYYEYGCKVYNYECRSCGKTWTEHKLTKTGYYFCDQCDS